MTIDESTLEDMARSEFEVAMSSGISLDNFTRLAKSVHQRSTLPREMTPELAKILGLMCFQCIPYAQVMRAAGRTIKSRAEDEQAAVLYWMLGHFFTHGEKWREAAIEDVEDMRKLAEAKQSPAPSHV